MAYFRMKLKTPLTFVLLIMMLVILKYSSYLTFLFSRGWYEWGTRDSKSDVIEVNIVDMNIIKHMDDKELNQNISKAYLGKLNLKITPEAVLSELYHLAFSVHNLFEKYKLKYFLAFGSAVGAIRDKGVILWDDDLDIVITEVDEKSILKNISTEVWRENNIQIRKGGKSVWDYKLSRVKSDSGMFPSCDIFVIELHATRNKYVFKNTNSRRIYAHEFNVSDVMNPELTQFGRFRMRVLSAGAYEYINNDKYWRHVALTPTYDHVFDQNLIPMAFEIPNRFKASMNKTA